jgi:hypothetical protein
LHNLDNQKREIQMARHRYLALLWLCLTLVPCAFSQRAGQDPQALQKFTDALKQDGFDVTPGVAAVYNPLGDFCSGKIPDAGLVNSGLYLIPTIPESAGAKTQTPRFKIREDEAIVLIGQTPPPAKYFGFYTHIYTRFYPDKKEGKQRTDIFGTVGDAVNNATIKTTGPSPFNRPFALIFTPDQGTDAGIRAALRQAGYPEAIINTNVLPASMLNLGHGETADQFQITLRTARFEDPIAGQSYIMDAPKNLHLLRVTPRTPAIANPFPMPPLRVRGTGESEMRLMNNLGELRARILEANSGLHATDLLSAQACYEDYDNLQRETWVDGGTRDAFILSGGWMMPQSYLNDVITLADDEFLMVYGVNHVATRKTTYMNINFYTTGREVNGSLVMQDNAFLGGVSDDDLQGSATGYLPGNTDANLMYAYKVSRSCGKDEPNCLPLAAPCARVTLDSSTVLGLYFRMYLEPATKVGAAMQEILYDRVIKFSPRPPAQQ